MPDNAATADTDFLDRLGVGVLVYDRDRGLVTINTPAARILGITREAARHHHPGHTPWQLLGMGGIPLPPDAHPVNRVFAGGTARSGDMVALRPADGSACAWLRLDSIPETAADGRRVVVTMADITEEYEALRHYRRSRDTTADILENASAAVCVTDETGAFTYVNRAYCHLYGYTESDLIGRNFTVVVPPEHRATLQATHDAFIAGEQEVRGEWEVMDAHGRRRTILADAVRLFDGEGRPCKATFIQDISERRRLETELERSNAELESFAYTVSHDLQEPLRMVANYAGLLHQRYESRLDTRGTTYLTHITQATQRMRRMIQGLLAYARVATRGGTFEAVPLETPVDEALANLETVLAETAAEVVVDRPLPAVHGDGSQLTRLFQNLTGNAVKYRQPARAPRITIGARPDAPGWWAVTVADNGQGLSADAAADIFQVFRRGHAAAKETAEAEEGGSGIGLAVAKRIVERHGGRIEATGTPGEGSTFTFTLPAAEDAT